MRLFVTGVEGYIGSVLAPYLMREGHEVVGLDTGYYRDGWLYFGSDRAGGHGRTDIYRALPDEVGGWRVENLGPNINSAGDEYEAEISPDGRRMILMADGDLYESRFERGRWRAREKLDETINTPALEVGPLWSPDSRTFLFARDSGDAALSGEIYRQRGGVSWWPPRCR